MATGIPSIACIAVIGKENNPLHISTFPPDTRPELQFSLLLSSTLDIFDVRIAHKVALQDFGLLQAVDERLACYGWLTNTGVKFVIVVDMAGRPIGADGGDGRGTAIGMIGLREADLRPAFNALQTAYIKLLMNPFYSPDDHTPTGPDAEPRSNTHIKSRKFINEINRIGQRWSPGISTM